MDKLPSKLIELILCYLPTQKDIFSLAYVSKRLFVICSSTTNEPLKLGNHVNSLQLRKHRVFIIQNQHYDGSFLNHLFLYAVNLDTIILDRRERYTFKFLLSILQAAGGDKKITIVVPRICEKRLNDIIEDEAIKNTNVKTNEVTQDANIQNMVTPESVRVRLEQEKFLLKAKHYFENGPTATMKDRLSNLIASPVNRFFNSMEYAIWDDDFSENQLLQSTTLTSGEATTVVDNYGPRFVESVVVFQDYWFLTASFSCSLHKNLQVDDCADNSTYGYQPEFKAFIRRKTRMGKDSFELTYRVGNLEILATSGFFGTLDGSFFSAFLGSALHEIPSKFVNAIETTITSRVFIPNSQKNYSRSYRILNQYFKSHSTINWGFYSKRFADAGFLPADPLLFVSKNIVSTSASYIIRSFALKEINQKVLSGLIRNIRPNQGKTLTSTGELIKKYLLFMKENNSAAFTLHSPKKNKRDLIDMYNNSLASSLSSLNKSKIKDAKKRYAATPIDLFSN